MMASLLLADCVVCVANETPNGWLALALIVLVGSAALAFAMAWMDGRNRPKPPQSE